MNVPDQQTASQPPTVAEAGAVRSYYGQPVVKQPAWTWQVPWYLFAGGCAGASSGLALGARLTGNAALAGRARLVAAAGALASPVLLIADLGRPQRFYNMLRVFKPTSAMSVGSWILTLYGPTAVGSGLLARLGRLPRLAAALDTAAAGLGMPMATYTAVLVADTSVPVWHEARGELPFVFAASAAASAGAAATLVTPPVHAGPARRLAIGAVAGELAADRLMRHRLGPLAAPYEQGDSGRWHTTATVCAGVGAGLMALGRRRRAAVLAGAALVCAGSLCQRWAVYRAGFASAADPAHTVRPQRERLDAGKGHRKA